MVHVNNDSLHDMKTIYSFLGIFVLILLFLGLGNSKQDIFMSPHVSQVTQDISENYTNEVRLCLDYVEINNDLFIYNYSIPETVGSNPYAIRAKTCDQDQISLHNHPHQHLDLKKDLREFYFNKTGEELIKSEQLLYLSKPDMRYMVKFDPDYTIVTSDGDYAWWTPAQVEEAFGKKELLKPVKGQTSH